MPNTSQSSFIPKNNLPNRQKIGRRYNFFFVSLVVYGLFIAAPISSAVVFIYEKYTNNVINQTTRDLDNAIKSFSESDFLVVKEFNNRLIASNEVLESSLSLNDVIQFFLQNAPRTVSFESFEVTTDSDLMVTVTADVASKSFDYVMFYRDELLRNPGFTSSEITDLSYKGIETSSGGSSSQTTGSALSEKQASKLSYKVSFSVPIKFFNQPNVLEEEQLIINDAETLSGTDNEVNI